MDKTAHLEDYPGRLHLCLYRATCPPYTVNERYPSPFAGFWSGRSGSNRRPTVWKTVTLPLSYTRLTFLAGKPGLEPRLTESESAVLPIKLFPNGAGSRSRTHDLLITSELLYRLSYAGINTLVPNNFELNLLHQITDQKDHKDQHTWHSYQKLPQER